MENLKISIEVNFGEAALATLDRLAQAFAQPSQLPQPEEKKAEKTPKKAEKTPKKAEKAPKTPEPTPAPEPAPTPAPEPVKTALGPDEDLPADDAPAPEKAKNPPTEAEMRSAIQATRKRGVAAKTIKDYIRETFGVKTSVECPEARRQELIDGLASLAA